MTEAVADLSAFLETVREKYHLPALAAAVSQEGRPDVVAACGVRKVDEPENRITVDDQFHFASCGKAMTAAIIHNRIENGELALDTPLAKIFPYTVVHPDRNATVAELLTHSSGLPNMPIELEWPVRKEILGSLNQAFTLEAMKQSLAEPPSQENTRGTFVYSNTGYALLGHIAEQVSGKPYETLVDEEIFKKLNMQSAAVRSVDPGAGVVWGHTHQTDAKGVVTAECIPVHDKDDCFPINAKGAGGMYATMSDWLKFMNYEKDRQRVLSPSHSVDCPQIPGEAKYTDSGLFNYPDGSIMHDGSTMYNTAREGILPDKKTTFVIVTNHGGIYSNGVRSTQAAFDEVTAYVKEHGLQLSPIDRLPEMPLPDPTKISGGVAATHAAVSNIRNLFSDGHEHLPDGTLASNRDEEKKFTRNEAVHNLLNGAEIKSI